MKSIDFEIGISNVTRITVWRWEIFHSHIVTTHQFKLFSSQTANWSDGKDSRWMDKMSCSESNFVRAFNVYFCFVLTYTRTHATNDHDDSVPNSFGFNFIIAHSFVSQLTQKSLNFSYIRMCRVYQFAYDFHSFSFPLRILQFLSPIEFVDQRPIQLFLWLLSFAAGGNSSMQDLSRDELTLLHNGCDKDSILTNDTTLERLKFGRMPDLESSSVSIKLEDHGDTFPWHTTSTDIGSNLL